MTVALITLPVLLLIGIDWVFSRLFRTKPRLRANQADNRLSV